MENTYEFNFGYHKEGAMKIPRPKVKHNFKKGVKAESAWVQWKEEKDPQKCRPGLARLNRLEASDS